MDRIPGKTCGVPWGWGKSILLKSKQDFQPPKQRDTSVETALGLPGPTLLPRHSMFLFLLHFSSTQELKTMKRHSCIACTSVTGLPPFTSGSSLPYYADSLFSAWILAPLPSLWIGRKSCLLKEFTFLTQKRTPLAGYRKEVRIFRKS